MIWLILILADLLLFYYLYIGAMAMIGAHAEGKLNKVQFALCVPYVAVAWVIDLIHNVTLFWLLFWERPREFTVTARLKRHVNQNTWRGAIARWLGVTLLNSLDRTGNHLD